MFVVELAESVHKIPIRRNGRAYSLGNAPLSPSAHAWTFPRLIKQTSPQGRTGGAAGHVKHTHKLCKGAKRLDLLHTLVCVAVTPRLAKVSNLTYSKKVLKVLDKWLLL